MNALCWLVATASNPKLHLPKRSWWQADMNADGKIEYEEFIPLALQIIQGMCGTQRKSQTERRCGESVSPRDELAFRIFAHCKQQRNQVCQKAAGAAFSTLPSSQPETIGK